MGTALDVQRCRSGCWGWRRRLDGASRVGRGAAGVERGDAAGAGGCGGCGWWCEDRSWFGLLVLYPVRDLMGFGFWAASYFGRAIVWRGRVFELLPGGRCLKDSERDQSLVRREIRTRGARCAPFLLLAVAHCSLVLSGRSVQRSLSARDLDGVEAAGEQLLDLGAGRVLGEEPLAVAGAPHLGELVVAEVDVGRVGVAGAPEQGGAFAMLAASRVTMSGRLGPKKLCV